MMFAKKKDIGILVRTTKDEKAKFIEIAKKSGCPSLTAWILMVLRKEK